MAKRKSTGKRQRFEIFKRDHFTCQYCGNQPPDVVLVVDHIKPVAEGGDNDPLNLITACEPCNQGKAHKPLGNVAPKPDADLEWLEMQQEIAELRRYQIAKRERDRLQAGIVGDLQDTWAIYFNAEEVPQDVVLLQWQSWATPEQIEEAIKIGAAQSFRLTDFDRRLRYVAGALHNIVNREKE